MTLCGNPLLRSLLGVKRTCLLALHMSANDPKRTWLRARPPLLGATLSWYDACSLSLGGGNETARQGWRQGS
jgi:hypothetical protein